MGSAIQGRLNASGRRFAVVAARFNSRLVDLLRGGAVGCLQRHGAEPGDIEVVEVPGAFEIPIALDALAQSGHYDALVALAVVIRGETPHFDYVCNECSKGVSSVMQNHGVPVGFGVLTTDTSAQAEERCGGKVGNKGWEAALAAIEMADLLTQIRSAGNKK